MSILTEAEQYQVKAGPAKWLARVALQPDRVLVSCCLRLEFRSDAMKVLLRNCDLAKQHIGCLSVVVLRIVRWNAALVTPKNLNLGPVDLRAVGWRGQQMVEFDRRAPAAQGDQKASALEGDRLECPDEF